MTNANQPAFPEQEFDNETLVGSIPGLTKREYFAAMAMQGLLAGNTFSDINLVAKKSVTMADALIQKLNECH